ncbi:MAG: PEP-CTERM sorting domain-containing protein [Candidatus Omnitrophota bacterium]
MKKLILLIALMMMLGLTTSAYAFNVYTLTIPQLSALSEVFDSPAGIASLASTDILSNSVWYEVTISRSTTQFRYILLGNSTLPPITDLTGYTHYGLRFDNDDDNEALVSVFLKSSGTRYLSSWVDLSYGASGNALLDLTTLASGGVDLSNIEEIGLGIAYNGSKKTNGKYQGDTLNILAFPVPEPGSMLLLGMGILGLFGLGRKKT